MTWQVLHLDFRLLFRMWYLMLWSKEKTTWIPSFCCIWNHDSKWRTSSPLGNHHGGGSAVAPSSSYYWDVTESWIMENIWRLLSIYIINNHLRWSSFQHCYDRSFLIFKYQTWTIYSGNSKILQSVGYRAMLGNLDAPFKTTSVCHCPHTHT